MMDTKRIHFTPSGDSALRDAVARYENELMDIIRSETYVPGQEEIEVTASDVLRARNQLLFISTRTADIREIVITLYMIIGAITILFGLFYNNIMLMIRENPIQIYIIMMGILIMAASVMMRWVIQRRRRNFHDRTK